MGDKAAAEAEIEAMTGGAAPAAPADAGADYPPLGLEKNIKKLPEWIQVGCGDKPYICAEKGATFVDDPTPDAMPDFSKHSNCLADALKRDPALYDKLKGLKTAGGSTLGQCIKTGVD